MFVIIIGLVILASTQNELLCWIGVGMIGVSATRSKAHSSDKPRKPSRGLPAPTW